ncbi:hypothetical protein H257_14576 [Aphanomyces astaci]|uniref:Uncharacterized protein n=1 Tax=Aphanomyces astaci TaxID=112090 RepID=W4FSB6_APHAT|nr:hypothetical protein H257_14576 [Aphanomyces astaci]ETV69724.1 hypothetical protein H257_14576 [Aphanomyces astaci]|eukprot:XP_009840740.1 hypothetical protein H257_14576 [Aphanomyces astaci]
MQVQGKIHSIKYPIFGIDWKRDAQGKPFVAIAGGGGAVKSGIKNCVTLARVPPPKLTSRAPPSLAPYLIIDTVDDLVSGVAIGSKGGLIALTMGSKTAIYRVTSGATPTASFVVAFQTDFAATDSYQNAVKFSPDGGTIATGGEDGVVRLWTLTIPPSKSEVDVDNKYRKSFKVSAPVLLNGHNGCINGLSWHASGTKVVSCAKDGQCIVWTRVESTWKKAATLGLAGELDVQKPDKPTNKGNFIYRGCAFVPRRFPLHASKKDDDDDDEIVTVQTPARGSSYLTKWSCVVDDQGKGTIEELTSIAVKDTIVCSLAVSAKYVATGSSDGQVLIHRVDTLAHLKTFAAHFLPSTGLAFFPFAADATRDPLDFIDDLSLMSASADYSVFVISGLPPSWYMYLLVFVGLFLYLSYFANLGDY